MAKEIKTPVAMADKAAWPNLIWVGLVGFVFGLAAFIFSWLLLKEAIGDWQVMLYAAPLAAFLSGVVGWGLLIRTGKHVTLLKGAGSGALIGLIAHPAAWYFSILYFYFSNTRTSLGEPTFNPLEGIWASLAFSVLSWLFVGWLTAPIGAAIGGALAYIQAKWDSKNLPAVTTAADSAGPPLGE